MVILLRNLHILIIAVTSGCFSFMFYAQYVYKLVALLVPRFLIGKSKCANILNNYFDQFVLTK